MVYSTGRKGGKTGFAAMMMLTAVLLFGGRFAEGYCVANEFENAPGRVYQAVSRIVECSPLLSVAKPLRDKIEFPNFGGAFISAIASDAAGAAGHNMSFATFDELWGFTSERSRRLWDENVDVAGAQDFRTADDNVCRNYEGESVTCSKNSISEAWHSRR